jgi:predicted outer membrane repeat protein
LKRIRLPIHRFAVTTAGVLIVGLLSVTAAAAKKPGHHGHAPNVSCSQAALVAAIDAANTSGGGTLNLAHRCDYRLTASPDNSENGLPVITSAIVINGNHATIDGTGSFRVFEVDGPGGSLSARRLTITGGSVQDFGGGIASLGGAVSLDHVTVTGNSAGAAGGGIASATFDPSSVATLTVRHSSVSDNHQTQPPSEDQSGGLGGGGIANVDGTAKLDHVQVNGNSAQGGVGGGIASGDYLGTGGATMLTLDHSQVNHNVAPHAGGGGIQNLLGTAILNHSQVDGNTSLNGGGIASGNQGNPSATAELRLNHSRVDGNTATAGPGGEGPPIAAGGIANGSVAVLNHSRVDRNKAPNGIGAGIVNHGAMTVVHSEVNRNTAAASGFAGSGGGILNSQGPPGTTPAVLTIARSRVNGNTAGGFGGGIANGVPLPPGGPPLLGGDVTLTHSQVKHNRAAHGGGIFNNNGSVTLTRSHVTGNHVDNCEPTNTIAGCTN